MDTEGLSAVDRETNFDAQILTLALLFSSVFLFNSRGVVDERSLRDLHFVSTLAKRILISQESGNNSEESVTEERNLKH